MINIKKMSNTFVLHFKLQDKFKTIRTTNCKYLSIQGWQYYSTQHCFIYAPKMQDVYVQFS